MLLDHEFIEVGFTDISPEASQGYLYDHCTFAMGSCQKEAFHSVLRIALSEGCESDLIRRIYRENKDDYQDLTYYSGWDDMDDNNEWNWMDDLGSYQAEYVVTLFWDDPIQMKLDSRLL